MPKSKRTAQSPQLGIFWLIRGKLVFDTSSLAEGEPYGDCKTHPRSHIDCWSELQRNGQVPSGVEYDVPPRGRVIHNARIRDFTIYGDKCILSKRRLLKEIIAILHLPAKTQAFVDEHYRCFECLGYDWSDD